MYCNKSDATELELVVLLIIRLFRNLIITIFETVLLSFANQTIMKNNYLLRIIDSYFEEITAYEGDLFTIKEVLKHYEKHIDFDSIRTDSLMELISTFRDPTIKGSGVNLFTTGHNYSLNKDNFKVSLERLQSRESLFVFSQIYESFESYMKSILSEFFSKNPTYLDRAPLFQSLFSESQNYKSFINKLRGRDRNNKKLLWTFRKLSPYYSRFELNNNFNYSYNIWFDLISDVRHRVIHNRQTASLAFINTLSENNKESIFNRYFEVKKEGSKSLIITDQMKMGQLIHEWNQYAFFIFKALSLELELDTHYRVIG